MNSGEILLVRHGADDESYIDGEFNTNLTNEGILQSRKMAKEVIKILNRNKVIDEVQMYISDKKRSMETYEIIRDGLEKHSYQHTLSIDSRLCGLREGNIINAESKNYQQKSDMLNSAWYVFDQARLNNNNNYHFGDPVLDGAYHKSIDDLIEYPYGESQNEFSNRVYYALSDMLSNTSVDKPSIVITHRGPISKIKHFIDSCNQSQSTEWHTNNELLKLDYSVVMELSVQDTIFCSNILKNYLDKKKHIPNTTSNTARTDISSRNLI